MIDPLSDLASLRAATERLLTAADAMDNATAAGPSRLPGWRRGHVLAHLSRNADALVNVFEGRPMYVSAEARDADIERDAGRPVDVQLADLRDSAARLAAVAALPGDWERPVELRNGVVDRAERLPFRRLVEIELHHVDLDIGYELEDLPRDFVLREITFLAERFAGHPGVPPTRIVASGDLGDWSTGGAQGEPVTVGGPPASLVGWLAGRRSGADLTVRTNSATAGPPVLPPL
ncbi:maleylpyruvate isomerase family mycothiol-dependent enzyme [Streptomyces sp. NPDC004609]|uniref:maleylpyruvate isomerase family mycothiol-dependent enzyme n=1 Tax=Streptomyces sp. NPDC004609 TaxID=3364704 RepID=UPI0036C753B2